MTEQVDRGRGVGLLDPPPQGTTPVPSGATRVTVYLPSRIWARVGKMALDVGISKTETLRRAISLLWFVSNQPPGGRLLYERPDGHIERLWFDSEA